jgi:hypothetical protein
MAKHYKETPWWWYMIVLVVSFVLGLIVVIKENITLPIWAYVTALLLGTIISPLVSRPRINFHCVRSNPDVEHPAICSLW